MEQVPQPEKNIKYFVLSTLSQLKKYGINSSDYVWLLEIATTYFSEELRAFSAPSLESVKMPINLAARVWSFPSDFLALSRVAYTDGKRLWNLTVDNNLDFTSVEPCEEPNFEYGRVEINPYWYYNVGWTGYSRRGAQNINYYRVDFNRRQIIFSESVPSGTGVIEYISAGKDIGENTLVPLGYAASFRKYIMWKALELSADKMGLSLAKDFERQYKQTLWDSNILRSPNASEYADAINWGTSFNLK